MSARRKVARRVHIPASSLPTLRSYANATAALQFDDAQPRQLNHEAARRPEEAPVGAVQPESITGTITRAFKLPRMLDVRDEPLQLPRDTRCWWDHHPFDSEPVGLPVKHDPLRNTYWMFGVFCCWNCAAAFSAESTSHAYNQRSRLMLHELLRQLRQNKSAPTQVEEVSCAPSPHWSLLRAYGGDWTIEQFRAAIRNRHARYHVYPPWLQIVPIGYLVYEEDRSTPLAQLFTSNYQVTNAEGAVKRKTEAKEEEEKKHEPAAARRKRKAAPEITAADLICMARPPAYRRNVMTGRREPLATESTGELEAKVNALRAHACRATSAMARTKTRPNIVDQLKQQQQQQQQGSNSESCKPTSSNLLPPPPRPATASGSGAQPATLPMRLVPAPAPAKKIYKRPAKIPTTAPPPAT